MHIEREIWGKIEKAELIINQIQESNTISVHSGDFQILFEYHEFLFQNAKLSKANFFILEVKNLVGKDFHKIF
jgi:hypothetical protein